MTSRDEALDNTDERYTEADVAAFIAIGRDEALALLREAGERLHRLPRDVRFGGDQFIDIHGSNEDCAKRIDTLLAPREGDGLDESMAASRRLSAMMRAPAAKERGEYICKCGLRVVPHRCKTGEDF